MKKLLLIPFILLVLLGLIFWGVPINNSITQSATVNKAHTYLYDKSIGKEVIKTFGNDYLRLSKDKDGNLYLAHRTSEDICGGNSWYDNPSLYEKGYCEDCAKPLADYLDVESLQYLGDTHLNFHFQDNNHRYRYQFTVCDSFIFLEERDDSYIIGNLEPYDAIEELVGTKMYQTLVQQAQLHLSEYSQSNDKVIYSRLEKTEQGYQLNFAKDFFYPNNRLDEMNAKEKKQEQKLPEYRMTFDKNGQYLAGEFIKNTTKNQDDKQAKTMKNQGITSYEFIILDDGNISADIQEQLLDHAKPQLSTYPLNSKIYLRFHRNSAGFRLEFANETFAPRPKHMLGHWQPKNGFSLYFDHHGKPIKKLPK